ncbi:MAG: ATP-binding protein, partial [Thermodesulfobacteriota bacterium]|nr:ATP-binding protein [Thermodesulfobacteriota bacterium]
KYLDRIDEPEVFDECTHMIISQVNDMKKLVEEFSAFAKMPTAMPIPDDLNKLVNDTVVLYRQAHTRIQYNISLDKTMPRVEIDRSQISRAIGNLLENATTAVEISNNAQRQITIKTQYDEDVHIASLYILDTGEGIPPNIMTRLFEPYFSTTKGGTGLGLVIVKRIINDHNGFIRVRNNEPTGTIFIIELPVKEGAA